MCPMREDVPVESRSEGERLDVMASGHLVPAVMWRPEHADRPPVVLLGHGGSGHKTDEFVTGMAARLVQCGIAALAIDAPFHGERALPSEGQLSYLGQMAKQGLTSVYDEACADWVAALDVAGGAGLVDTGRVGYIGLSMGSNFGFPLCALLGPRLSCAVLGKLGNAVSPGFPSLVTAPEIVIEAARALQAPVLMHMQWDDEIFPRDGQLALFESIGSANKVLHARPGPHGFTHPDDEASWASFMSRHLLPAR